MRSQLVSNTFDAEEINKQVAEIQQKEKLKKVRDAVSLHEGTQKLKRIVEGKLLAQELDNVDFETSFDDLSEAAKQDISDRANSSEFLFPEMGDFALFGPR